MRRRRRQRAERILPLLLSFLVLCIGAGVISIVWIRMDTKDRSGKLTGPVILAQAKILEKRLPAEALQVPQKQEEEAAKGETEQREDAAAAMEEPEETEAPSLRIVLDPGHGGPGLTDEQELGAIYRDTYEKYLTLEIARAMEGARCWQCILGI